MIETRRLKNIVIFIQIILSFVLSRKIINIYNDITRKYGDNIWIYESLVFPNQLRLKYSLILVTIY